MPQISVIVPVYNVEKYLARCIDSILVQSFTDFEVILVDDGSSDNSGKICDDYKTQDNRIVVIHQNNQGQAAARNRALDIDKGEYISFIDSDDYVHPNMFSFLVELTIKKPADIYVFKYYEGEDNSFTWKELNDHAVVKSGKTFLRECILNDINRCWILCDKLFSRKCFNSIRLPEGRIHEDNATVYKLLYAANQVAINDSVPYYYYTNPKSTMNIGYSLKRLDWLVLLEEMIPFFIEHDEKELENWANRFYLESLCSSYKKVKQYYPQSKEEMLIKTKLIKQYKSEKKKYIINMKSHPHILNVIHPTRSKVYWTLVGIKSKLKKQG